MAVLAVARGNYHAFGRAINRLMADENVQARNQKAFADGYEERIGYPVSQQYLSDVMRMKPNGEPRQMPTPEFVAATIKAWKPDDARREDLLAGWLAILPERRRRAYFDLCAQLAEFSLESEVSSASEDLMVDYEADRKTRKQSEGDKGGRSAGGGEA